MQTIYVSNKGEDKNNGLTLETPVLSWKRLQVLCKHYEISVHTKPRKVTDRR